MSSLEARVTALEQQSAVLAALHRYGPALDYGNEREWVDCFTADGEFSATDPRGQVRAMSIRGAEALLQFAQGHSRAPDVWHKHLVVDPVIDADAGRARSSSYYVLLVADADGVPAIGTFGRYEDDLEPGPDGRWRFAHRHITVESWSPLWNEVRNSRRRMQRQA